MIAWVFAHPDLAVYFAVLVAASAFFIGVGISIILEQHEPGAWGRRR